MARRPRNAAAGAGDAAPPAYRFERLIMLALAVVLVGVMIYIVLVNPTLNSTSRLVLFILTALTAAGFFAFLPGGAFHLKNTIGGLLIKASGGAAAFVIVLFLLFRYYPDDAKSPELQSFKYPDLRSSLPPDDPDFLNGRVALILPVGFTAGDAPVPVKELTASVTFNGQTTQFGAAHFTVIEQQNTTAPWLPNTGNFLSGDKFSARSSEVVFYPLVPTSWESFMRRLNDSGAGVLTISLQAEREESGTNPQRCTVDLAPWIGRIRDAVASRQPYPARLSMHCSGG